MVYVNENYMYDVLCFELLHGSLSKQALVMDFFLT